ncbi:MAG: hypothetical protein GPOALKHO_000595 [Sodalis sp.]|nr:MAG: hypothetical protein GPOALKHO_000595 [Sodalis sp.]
MATIFQRTDRMRPSRIDGQHDSRKLRIIEARSPRCGGNRGKSCDQKVGNPPNRYVNISRKRKSWR